MKWSNKNNKNKQNDKNKVSIMQNDINREKLCSKTQTFVLLKEVAEFINNNS